MSKSKIFFWTNSHSFHKTLYHLVFTPKYRRRVLQGRLKKRLEFLLYQCGEVNNWFIHELEVMPDHVHILVQIPHTIPISQVAMYFKGGSSKILRKEFPEIEEFLWGDSLWQDGYFVESIGRIDEKNMRKYIQEQKKAREQ
jgi:putative transposase